MSLARSLLLAGTLSVSPSLLLAEGTTRLYGHVADASGRSLPGVTVEARGVERSQTTVSDAAGAYSFAGLHAGTYDLAFKLPSFATSLKRHVGLREGEETEVDAALQLALSSDVLVTAKRTFRNLADLDTAANELIGIASAATQGVVTAAQIEQRAAYRAAEVLETVPGVVISQHSGEGKANQYYVRGFNIDHGTDLATTVAGIPVNLPTHAHGQGYSDLNFLIPELVSGVQYKKGPYYAEEGDFSAAGAINVNYLNLLDRPLLKLEGGYGSYERLLLAASPRLGRGHLLLAGEVLHHDGPWVRPDELRKLNALVRYSQGDQQAGFSLTGMAYHGEWNSTDQIPRRAMEGGALGRFDTIDPTAGGLTYRYALSGSWRRSAAGSLTETQGYAFKYGLDLFSNFTYFLDDPVNGDQFEQQDRRLATGLKLSHRWFADWGGRDAENVVGIQLRNDDIPTLGLYHTNAREILDVVREDAVSQRSGSLYVQNGLQWSEKLRTVAGLRGDVYHFDVRGGDPANSGSAAASLVSPKLTLVMGPFGATEVYANWGWGFHSNDGRGATLTRDPKSHEPAARVAPLVPARGAEIGLRTSVHRRFQSTLALWGLDIASELVFVGDAGSTDASRASRRLGVEWANYLTPWPWMTLDADLAWSRARFRDQDPAGTRVPGAIEGVASAGVSIDDLHGFSGSLRLRYFGPRPLVEDDSVRSKASTLLNARASYRMSQRLSLALDLFNLTDAKVSDIDYFYTSRLRGEPLAGVDDLHTHPIEPRSFRVSLTTSF